MAVRKLKPTTPGQRHKIIGVFDDITKRTPEKSLTVGKRSTGGRNNEGHLTARYRGGGHRRKLRLIDFKRNKDGVPAVVKAIEYDPNRSARIALLYYADGYKAYIIAPNGLEVGATIESGENVAPEVGNALPLSKIPVGTLIHNIDWYFNSQHRIASRSGCRYGTCSRHLRTAHQPRGYLRNHQITFGRDPQGPRYLQGYRGCRW